MYKEESIQQIKRRDQKQRSVLGMSISAESIRTLFPGRLKTGQSEEKGTSIPSRDPGAMKIISLGIDFDTMACRYRNVDVPSV